MPDAQLFPPLTEEVQHLLEGYIDLLKQVFPLKSKHHNALPYAVRDLSRALTAERADLAPDYLQAPANVGAYLYYFLPWNLVRLTPLLTSLTQLDPPEGAVLLDLGAGPLTLAQALWLARPELRERALTIHCVDRANKPMRLGFDLLRGLAKTTGHEKLPWRIEFVQESALHAPAMFRRKVDVLMAANLLNELGWRRRELWEDQMAERLERFFSVLKVGGQVLFIEPGTRLGGGLTATAREAALFDQPGGQALIPLAPCTHAGACPYATGRSWCHFVAPQVSPPAWLASLTRAAKFERDRIALSYVHLGPPELADYPMPDPETEESPQGTDQPESLEPKRFRVLSDPFRAPENPGRLAYARYLCGSGGLALLLTPGGHGPAQGDILTLDPAKDGKPVGTDPKTRAPMYAPILPPPPRGREVPPRLAAPEGEKTAAPRPPRGPRPPRPVRPAKPGRPPKKSKKKG